jgi:hypothetical protein
MAKIPRCGSRFIYLGQYFALSSVSIGHPHTRYICFREYFLREGKLVPQGFIGRPDGKTIEFITGAVIRSLALRTRCFWSSASRVVPSMQGDRVGDGMARLY